MDNEIVQYFVVNQDLLHLMDSGKIAGQVAHVATTIALKHNNDTNFLNWYNNDQKKIILKAKQNQLEKLLDKENVYYTRDLGLTQIPKGSLTVIGLKPMKKLDAYNIIPKRWRLL